MNEELFRIIDRGKRIVFFGGAGVSTESGIPDFRSENGLYHAMETYERRPEELISHSFYRQDPDIFFDYYKKNLIHRDKKPNPAHLALAKLEEEGKLLAVVTQNIDGLHQMAGSKHVHELHGSIQRNTCSKCGAKYDLDYIMNPANCLDSEGRVTSIPRCKSCQAIVKPDVVLYEEPLDENVIRDAVEAISEADVLLVGGTSLVVYPAAGLIRHFQGDYLVLINKTKTPYDSMAHLVIHEPIGQVLGSYI